MGLWCPCRVCYESIIRRYRTQIQVSGVPAEVWWLIHKTQLTFYDLRRKLLFKNSIWIGTFYLGGFEPPQIDSCASTIRDIQLIFQYDKLQQWEKRPSILSGLWSISHSLKILIKMHHFAVTKSSFIQNANFYAELSVGRQTHSEIPETHHAIADIMQNTTVFSKQENLEIKFLNCSYAFREVWNYKFHFKKYILLKMN